MKRGISIIIVATIFLTPFAGRGDYRRPIGEDDIIDRVLVAAPDTLIAREDLGTVEADLMQSKSIFDTYLSANSNYTRDEFDKESTFFGTRTDTANWNIGLSKKLPIGTTTSLEWSNQRERLFGVPTIAGVAIFPTAPTYESTLNFALSQPMMKNFAGMVDRGTVSQAKKALSAADYGTKYQIASIAEYALILYWRWVVAHAYITAYNNAVANAQQFLKITLERSKLGTAEETDVLAARANLINRKNGLLDSKRTTIQVEKDLKVILGFDADDPIRPRDRMPRRLSGFYTNRDEAISMALANRWDYLAQKDDVERSNIQLVSAKNERWPELDIVSTLAANGLDNSYSQTMGDVDHPYWTIGMTFSIPLENRASRAQYKKAKHEKSKSVIELKKKENDIANEISELLRRWKVDKSVLANAQTVERLQKEKLIEEMKKYSYGRSNSELVILYQDDRLYAEIYTLRAWNDYIKTVLDLRLAQNVLIE